MLQTPTSYQDTVHNNGYEFSQGTGYQLPEYPFIEPPELATGEVKRHDVVIVGGGLAGLTLACALAQYGVKALLLDEDNTVGVKGASSRGICYAQKTLEILPSCQALLFSDYDKGVLSRKMVQALTEAAEKQGIPITANPKPTSIAFYKGVTVAQLNRGEAQEASKRHLPFLEMDDIRFHEYHQLSLDS